MNSTVTDILGESGAIARRLGMAYEARPQQLEMAAAVSEAMDVGHHLLVEAGTGVGKSFAYLIPAIDYVVRTKKRVVISTHTIALQEQLVEKDIPLLQSVYPDEFSAVLVKGRGNYLCRRRLDQARARQHMLFDHDAQLEALWAIENWAEQTHDGSLASLPVLPDPSVWEKVNAEQGNCLGKRCRFYEDCHWQSAKRRMQSGQLLIVNHALFFSDLALRMAGVNYLPKYDAVIFDEAHTLEDVAGQHFGMRVSEASVKYQLRALYDARRGAGVLSTHGGSANNAIRCVVELGDVVDTFFDRIAWWQESHGRTNGRVHEANIVPNDLSPKLHDLTKYLKEMLPKLGDSEESVSEITSLAAKVSGTAETIDVMISQSMPDAVYWFDISKRGPRRVSMHAAPVDVAEGLRQQLFAKVPRVVLTSATLATASEKSKSKSSKSKHPPAALSTENDAPAAPDARFAFIQRRLGIDNAQTLHLGSPFDYENQVILYLESDLPDPSDSLRFTAAACEKIVRYLDQTNGGAFVLFTSYRMLTDCANILKDRIESLGLPMLVQGQNVSRKMLLDQFRALDNAVLFGTSSFWQGIDVQGDKLRNVIIVKLPFAVPDEPLIEAKLEAIRRHGGNPFMDLQVPEAIIKLKQGFGRLIRSKSDTGIVVLLDGRVRTKRYGPLFLDALPKCRIIDVR
ncbi:MAG: DEAD/DEAH box helicase [Burkholderiales bacterium]|nr:DEAD/DEAH box helicase [Phycisphaerae bacterium]